MAAIDPIGRARPSDLKEIVSLVEEDLARVEVLFAEQFRSDVALVSEIGRYVQDGGGKRIRPALLLLACGLCGYRGLSPRPCTRSGRRHTRRKPRPFVRPGGGACDSGARNCATHGSWHSFQVT